MLLYSNRDLRAENLTAGSKFFTHVHEIGHLIGLTIRALAFPAVRLVERTFAMPAPASTQGLWGEEARSKLATPTLAESCLDPHQHSRRGLDCVADGELPKEDLTAIYMVVGAAAYAARCLASLTLIVTIALTALFAACRRKVYYRLTYS